MILTDDYVTSCEAQHHDPVDGCLHCEARAAMIIEEPALDGGVILRDGFDRELTCCEFHQRQTDAIEATKILARIA